MSRKPLYHIEWLHCLFLKFHFIISIQIEIYLMYCKQCNIPTAFWTCHLAGSLSNLRFLSVSADKRQWLFLCHFSSPSNVWWTPEGDSSRRHLLFLSSNWKWVDYYVRIFTAELLLREVANLQNDAPCCLGLAPILKSIYIVRNN